MCLICSLKPNLTREEAVRRLRVGGVLGLASKVLGGPLRSVADVYIPFCLYDVDIADGARHHTSLLGLEAVAGSLDLFRFDRLPSPEETVYLETRNHPEPRLEEPRAQERLTDKVRRMVFGAGFFRIRDLRIQVQPVPFVLHIPYWVGFFGRGQQARVAVIDGVRCRFEGARARQLVYDWLTT